MATLRSVMTRVFGLRHRDALGAKLSRVLHGCQDLFEQWSASRDPKIPPRLLNYNQAYKPWSTMEYEREFRRNACLREIPFLVRDLGLKKDGKVLDYGCGIGRLTYALDKYLNDDASYLGVDIVKASIDFLTHAYRDRKSFRFQHVPVDVRHYDAYLKHRKLNEDGCQPSAVKIGAGDHYFDFQISNSVFTHMFAADIVATLREIKRTLKPDGVCVNSFLIVDDHTRYMLQCGLADRQLPFEEDGMYYYDKQNILVCTAYSLEKVREIYEASGHTIQDIRYGSWAGRDNQCNYQDLVISRVAA